MTNNIKSIHLVDITKFVAALLVVAIHAQPLRYNEALRIWLFWPIVSLAVPYFLIISSYFFWNRETPNLKKYLCRIGLLYVVWLMIDSPILYKQLFSNGASFQHNILIFLRGLFFGQTFPGSWYLCCSIWAISISYFFWKKKIRMRIMLCLGIILYFTGKIILYFLSILPEPIANSAGMFYRVYGIMQISTFSYFIYVFMGYWLVVEKKYFEAFRSKWWLIIGLLITILELSFNHIYEFPISVIAPLFIIPWLFVYTVTTSFSISDSVALRLRKMSTLVFFIHPTFVRLLPPFGKNFEVSHPIQNYIIVVMLSVTLAFVLSSDIIGKKIPLVKKLY